MKKLTRLFLNDSIILFNCFSLIHKGIKKYTTDKKVFFLFALLVVFMRVNGQTVLSSGPASGVSLIPFSPVCIANGTSIATLSGGVTATFSFTSTQCCPCPTSGGIYAPGSVSYGGAGSSASFTNYHTLSYSSTNENQRLVFSSPIIKFQFSVSGPAGSSETFRIDTYLGVTQVGTHTFTAPGTGLKNTYNITGTFDRLEWVEINNISADDELFGDFMYGANSITTGTISPSTYCAGTAVSVPFTISGTYNSGNVFTAQLSNPSGSFTSPVNIGTLTSTSSGTISATIPPGTVGGAGYLIRVVSSNPVITTDLGKSVTIDLTPPVVTCPANISVNNTPNTCGAVATYTTPTATDNCSVVVSGSQTFNYTGGAQTFIVPSGVTSLFVDVKGAAGYGLQGKGGRVEATIPVTPGESLQINVGGAGTETNGGFNGGGSAGANNGYGSGGGASDIRKGGTALGNRYIVAGGGGGSGSNCGTWTAEGGNGGGLIGQSGCVWSCSDCQYTGAGGSQIAGGTSGPTGHPSCPGNQNGSLGQGGSNTTGGYGTGGGGGYYGGGSGCFEGAGGGSSYTNPLASGVVHTQGFQSGDGQVIISWNQNTNPSVSQTLGLPSGATFPVGVTTNTFSATDASGNTGSCSFTVTVTDNQAPTITCPANIPVNSTTGTCGAIVTYTAPTGTDNCPGASTTQTGGLASGATFPVGVTTNTFRVTATNGATSTCSFTVTVTDAEAPTITCPANIPVNNTTGTCGAVVTYITPIGTDNCPGVSTTQTGGLASGSTFPVGVTTNTFRVTAANGETSTCSFTVTVTDAEAPTITCPASFSVPGTSGASPCKGPATYTAPVGTDNCPGATTVLFGGLASGSLFPEGINTVTYRVSDASGNTATCSFTITVGTCNRPPVAVCQNITVNTNANCQGTATAAMVNNGSNDPDGDVLTYSILPAGPYTLGTTGVVLTVTDPFGLSSTCNATITVRDITPPTAVCQPLTVNLSAGGSASITASQINNGSSDACGILSTSLNISSFNCSNVGSNNIVLTVTDVNTNSSTCSTTVTIRDVTAPTALCQAVTVNLNAAGTGSITASQVNNGSSDACGTPSLSVSPSTFNCTNVSSTVSTTPNAADLFFTEYIEGSSNNKAVEIFNGTGVAVNLSTGGYKLQVYFNGSGSSTDFPLTGTIGAGDVFVFAASTANAAILAQADQVTSTSLWNGDDAIVLVKGSTVLDVIGQIGLDPGTEWGSGVASTADNTIRRKSTITGGDVNGADSFDPSAEWDGFATDNSANLGSHTFAPAPVITTVPTLNPVVLTVTDVNGNTTTCSANVTVRDVTAPTAVCQNLTVDLSAATGAGAASITATQVNNGSSDACGISTTSINNSTFSCANVGSGNTVVLTVTDVNGNSSTCSSTITVRDVTAPTAICKNVTINLNSSGAGSIVTSDINNGSTDNCSIFGYSLSNSNFTCANVSGPNTVILTVTDVNTNSSTCSASVTVRDLVAPLAVCQPLTVNLNASGSGSITAEQVNNGSSDACGISTKVLNNTSFTCANVTATTTSSIWINEFHYDNAGADVNEFIEIAGNAGINLAGNSLLLYNGSGGAVYTTIPLSGIIPNFGSGFGALSFSAVGLQNGNPDGIALVSSTGVIEFLSYGGTMIAVGGIANGQSSTDVGVTESGSANGTSIARIGIGTGGSQFGWTVSSIQTPGAVNNGQTFGNNQVVLTVTDVNGNSSSCSSTITVRDLVAPVAVCQPLTVDLNASGAGSITADQVNNGSSDACGIANKSLDNSSFNCLNIGNGNTVILTVTDVNGNSSTCSSTITVRDLVAPVAVCQPLTVDLNAAGIGSITADQVNNGSSDACGISNKSLDNSSFNCLNVGNGNTVILTVTDANTNSSSCSSTITVRDLVAPVAQCQNVTVQLSNTGSGTTTADVVNNGSSDACGIASKVLSQTSFTCSEVGPNTEVLTVTDVNGNSNTCTTTVTVEDNVLPTAICRNVTVNLDNTGNGSTTASAVSNGSTDACGLLPQCTPSGPMVTCLSGLMLDNGLFDCNNIGNNVVTLTVTDVYYNSSTCTANVTVRDLVAPVAICQPVTVNLNAAGTGSITAAQVDNLSNDACGIQSLSVTPNSFNCSNVGANSVVLTVTDVNGNSSTCSAVVTVRDQIAPVPLCKNITVALDANGNASVTPAQINNTSTDACGIASLTINSTSLASFNCTNTGTNTLILKVTDVNGNSATCTSVVTVTGGALFNYVILASKKVDLHHSNVLSGGIGLTTASGEAEIEKNTLVTAPGTFVQSMHNDINSGAIVTTQYHSVAVAPIPPFEYNVFTSNNNVTVASGQTVILNSALYNEVKVEKYGTVIFTQPVVDIKKLEAKDFAEIKFTQCTKLRIKEHLHLKRNSLFNPDGLGVTLFAQKHVDVKEGCKVYATIYSLEKIDVKGKENNRTSMTGLFVGTEVGKGDYTDWNANTQCGKCSLTNSLSAKVTNNKDINCDGATNGSITVTATGGTAPYTYLWSNGQTSATATNLGAGTYSVVVTDALGSTTTVNASVVIFTYTLLASDEIKIGKNDSVLTGSVGITNVNGNISIDQNSSVEDDISVVRAPIININASSTVNDIDFGIASPVSVPFEGNITYLSTSDLNVPNNSIVTLTATDTLRRKVIVGDNATLIITADVLNITDKLELKKRSVVKFVQACSKVRIKGDLITDDKPVINPDGKQVIFHVNGGNVKFRKGADVTATIYAPNALIEVENASAPSPNEMTGKFIGKKISSGDYTNWYESTACPCSTGSGSMTFRVTPENNPDVKQTSVISDGIKVNAYPNPFKHNATISFMLPEYNKNVRVIIFNLEGKELKLLYNGATEANVEYQLQVNTDNSMESGIYFYKLETAEGKSIVNKLILIK